MKPDYDVPRRARMLLVAGLVLVFLQAIRPWLRAAESGAPPDRCSAPYFKVMGSDNGVDELPLKNTAVVATIDGMMARVEVTQEYANAGSFPIEATYVFPASTRAAVHGMTMEIGDRVIAAKIAEKEEAKATYEKAKGEKKTTSLLEEHRPNVFQMSVANILPGDTIRVRFVYTETVVPENGIYVFVFPTVAGPRYQSARLGDQAASAWVESPFLAPGDQAPATFRFNLAVRAGGPLNDAACPSHPAAITFPRPEELKVDIAGVATEVANRDIITRYRLSGPDITTGLLLDEGKDDNHFLLTIDPPRRPNPESIPPRDYVFVVDVSGSMDGFPLDTAKKFMSELLGGLRTGDRFNVVLFAGSSRKLAPDFLSASPANIENAGRFLKHHQAGGGTELLPALDAALAMTGEEGRSRTIVAITDGYIAEEPAAFARVRAQLGAANFFAFGIGGSVNRHLIEGLARAGRGEPAVVTKPAEAAEVARKFREQISSPLLTDIRIEFEGFETSEVEPSGIPDLFAARPLQVFGKWKGQAGGKIHVRGQSGDGPLHAVLEVAPAAQKGMSHPALPVLWAREKVRNLIDFAGPEERAAKRAEITRLALRYELLTPYTSFVAVDEVVRDVSADLTKVAQASPLPQHVGVTAVGGGSVPEPGTAALLMVSLATLCLTRRRE